MPSGGVSMDGVINVLKPPGMTSHDVVSFMRRVTGIKKCGHTGTLDPGATGVLPICIGKATRLARFVTEGDKIYRAELVLGVTTTSQDSFGEIIETKDASTISQKQTWDVMSAFIREIEQTPPMASAIKVDGKRLYELERMGKTIEVPTRVVNIYEISLINSWDWLKPHPRVLFDVTCSKGTYVRTLCSDIGKALGCGAYMSFLLRTKVASFELDNSITLENIVKLAERKQLESAVIPMHRVVQHFPCVEIIPTAQKAVTSGATLYPAGIRSVSQDVMPGDLVRIQIGNQLLGVYKAQIDNEKPQSRIIYKPEVVFVY